MALSIPPFLTLPTFGAVSVAPPPPNPLTSQEVFDSLAFPFTIWMAGFGLELSDRISTMNLLVSGLNTNTTWMKEAYDQTLALSNHVDARKIEVETLRDDSIAAAASAQVAAASAANDSIAAAASAQVAANYAGMANPTNSENISFPPSGNISATNAKTAIQELDAEKAPKSALLTQADRNAYDLTNPDLNNIKSSGFYHIMWTDASASTTGHSPIYSNGILKVFSINGTDYVAQEYTTWNNYVFSRTLANGTWSSWSEVATSTRLKTVGGQSLIGTGDIPISSGGLGVGQTWQNLAGTRYIGLEYANNSGKPIAICVSAITQNTCQIYAVVKQNGVNTTIHGSMWYSPGSNVEISVFAIIPNGASYVVNTTGTASLNDWAQLG